MTELEWLKQESGMTDEELKAMEAAAGSGKFKAFLVKAVAANTQATADKTAAEQARIDLEHRYNNEFLPEMRKVTQDALGASSRAAAAEAALKQAREYGIVPPEATPPAAVEPRRAPGSPDPNMMTRAEFDSFRGAQSRTIIAVNDLSAEHFKLFGQPLGGTQELVDEVQRQHALGNKNFTLKQAWETKHGVAAKREELTKAERQKEIDVAIAADRKTRAEASGPNGNLRSGQTSRFSTYKPTDAAGGKEPWKAPHSINERNRGWREKAISKVREAMAS